MRVEDIDNADPGRIQPPAWKHAENQAIVTRLLNHIYDSGQPYNHDSVQVSPPGTLSHTPMLLKTLHPPPSHLPSPLTSPAPMLLTTRMPSRWAAHSSISLGAMLSAGGGGGRGGGRRWGAGGGVGGGGGAES